MNNELLKTLVKPPLYTKSKAEFWNDEYISLQMLKSHLDPDFEGASRKMNYIDKSVAWITKLVPPDEAPELLDLGCGPGIYDEKFTKMGYQVTGVDFSKRSINYAKQSAADKKLNILYYYLNYLQLDMQKNFDFITMIYCDYGALSTDDRREVLKRAYQHLKPGGKFLFDVFTMKEYDTRNEEQTWCYYPNGGFWRADEHAELNGFYKYEDHIMLQMVSIISNEKTEPYYLWDTFFTKETLKEEVEACGFKVVQTFGGIAGEEYQKDSKTMAVLLEKL